MSRQESTQRNAPPGSVHGCTYAAGAGTHRSGLRPHTPRLPSDPDWPQRVRPRPFLASSVLASLESPGLALRGSPVRRDDSSLDCHLCPAHPCALGEPSELTAERGHPPRLRAQSPGCPFFRFLALGMQRKEPVLRGWVSRQKASVRWTLGPANGLATDGKHRTCKREHGERSAASPLINNRRVGDTSR